MRFLIVEEKTYHADADKLKDTWPEEYESFLRESADESDRAWVQDCIASGGLELIEFQDSIMTVDSL